MKSLKSNYKVYYAAYLSISDFYIDLHFGYSVSLNILNPKSWNWIKDNTRPTQIQGHQRAPQFLYPEWEALTK